MSALPLSGYLIVQGDGTAQLSIGVPGVLTTQTLGLHDPDPEEWRELAVALAIAAERMEP